MTRVLSVTSECAPLIKTGGLADVAGALPLALAGQGVQMRTLLPGYPAVMAQIAGAGVVWETDDLFGGPARVMAAEIAGLHMLALDARHLFARAGSIYLGPDGLDWPDNPLRFAALSQVAALLADSGVADDTAGGWRPQVLHCHDWQAGLTPTYVQIFGTAVATVMTVHNMAFQGLAPVAMLDALGLPSAMFTSDGIEFHGRISALKAGLVHADALTTVSPTYATELMTPEYGMGLDGVIRARAGDMTGILNGIDGAVWDPAGDAHARQFSTRKGKATATAALRRDVGLPATGGPLAVVVSRLSQQKGLDLLLDALPAFLDAGGQLALLGAGDAGLERAWRAAADHPSVVVRLGYDEPLAHRMIAGGDMIVVPSRFEPCGLTQLYGLRYGTVPVVARTGGLADTVVDANDAGLRAGVATGLQFAPVTADALARALARAVALYAQPSIWNTLVRNAMRHPVDWQASAAQYAALYRRLTDPP